MFLSSPARRWHTICLSIRDLGRSTQVQRIIFGTIAKGAQRSGRSPKQRTPRQVFAYPHLRFDEIFMTPRPPPRSSPKPRGALSSSASGSQTQIPRPSGERTSDPGWVNADPQPCCSVAGDPRSEGCERPPRRVLGNGSTSVEFLPRTEDGLAGVARLAGHFAHDFNNLLAIIGSSAAVLKETHDALAVERIVDAAERGRLLTRRMMAFGQRQRLQPMVVDLSEQSREFAAELKRQLPNRIELRARCYEEALCARLDPTQFRLALAALVDNAVAAMPNGGALCIDVESITLSGLSPSAAPRDHVMVAVSDCGTGMSSDVQREAFKPFYTTDPRRAGMGLSEVYGIVQQSGGALRLDTAPDQGTTVAMYFPEVGSVCAGADRQTPSPAANKRTILLVDDDAPVRRSVGRLLRLSGFSVLEADSGQQALRLARAHEHELVLVLSDVVMPEMNGIDLARRLRRLAPQLPVLLTSGFAPHDLRQDGTSDLPFIQKPSTREELLGAIEALTGPATIPSMPVAREALRSA